MSGAYEGRQIVGMDLHRRRSVLVRMTETGDRLETVRISNDPQVLREVMTRAGECPEVVLEATYGWYWAADTLAGLGASVHLAHPLGVKAFSYRRVKNDERDAADLADLLRMGRLPEAWIAPPATRELRELVRHRAKLVGLRSNLKCKVHALLAGAGVPVHDERPVRRHRPAAAGPGRADPGSAGPGELGAATDRRVWTSKSSCSPGSPATGCMTILAIGRSNRSTESGRSWPRCSSPRSVTSPASPDPPSWPAGPG